MKRQRLAVLVGLMVGFATGPATAGPMDGVWVGEYACAQGKTALALTIQEAPNGARVLFQFSGTPQNPTIPMGSFEMMAAADPFSGGLVFKPVRWVQQPTGYTMVGLKGKLYDQNTLMGDVTGAPGCTTFIVRRGASTFAGTFQPQGFHGSINANGAGITVQMGAPGGPGLGASVQVHENGMNAQMPGVNMGANMAPPTGPTANINVTITETRTAGPVAVTVQRAQPETCRSALLAKGHSSSALIHCGEDVNQACAVALLKAGHSPAALIHCEDIGSPACAVQLMERGRSPAEIVHCD